MTVKLDSGKMLEVLPENSKNIDYGYAVENLKKSQSERVLATGDVLNGRPFQGASPKSDLTLYTAVQDNAAAIAPEIIPTSKVRQKDFGIEL